MTYNPNIPQGADSPGQVSRAQMQTNFSQINTCISNDHFAFDNATVDRRGRHQWVNMVTKTSEQTPSANSDGVFYLATKGGKNVPHYSTTQFTGVMQMTTRSNTVLITGNGTYNMYNFSTANLPSCIGQAIVYDVQDNSRMILGMFIYISGTGLFVPPSPNAQLISGTTFTTLLANANTLQLVVANWSGPNHDAKAYINFTPITP